MHASLFLLLAPLAIAENVPRAGVVDFVDDLVTEVASVPLPPEVVAELSPGGDEAAARARLARAAGLFAWSEARWRADAVNPVTGTLGPLQVSPVHLGGVRRRDLLADRRVGLRLGLRVMVRYIALCGTVRSGLGGFASGSCRGALDLVDRRCALVGGC